MPAKSRIYSQLTFAPYWETHKRTSRQSRPRPTPPKPAAPEPPPPERAQPREPLPRPSKRLPMARAIADLDRLDGYWDGYYYDLPLHMANTTGHCEIVEVVRDELGSHAQIEHEYTMIDDEFVELDCDELAARLTSLSEIAIKIPAFSLMSLKNGMDRSERLIALKRLTFEDMLGYHMVDHMISALILAIGTTDKPSHELFTEIVFEQYSAYIDGLGRRIGNSDMQGHRVDDAAEAYEILEDLGEKYGFETSQFKPR